MTADPPAPNGTIRLGILGAARIAPLAVIRPAAGSVETEVVAVAARDAARANRFAAKYGIARAYPGYAELLADPDVDAVYNPLPNGMHGHWTTAALEAGKHVLCEKPFTANAEEARRVADAAAHSDRVVMEAFHYRYHPLMLRARQIVDSGELGRIRRVQASLCIPFPRFSDIRYDVGLAGGATMDTGCYAIHMIRLLGRADVVGEPSVISATAKTRREGVDLAMRAELEFPAGYSAWMRCSLWSARLLAISARVIGEDGELTLINPVMPQLYHQLSVQIGGDRRVEHFNRRPSYAYQLDAFAAAVLRGVPVPTDPSDAVANMIVIDAIYRAAGLPLREPTR